MIQIFRLNCQCYLDYYEETSQNDEIQIHPVSCISGICRKLVFKFSYVCRGWCLLCASFLYCVVILVYLFVIYIVVNSDWIPSWWRQWTGLQLDALNIPVLTYFPLLTYFALNFPVLYNVCNPWYLKWTILPYSKVSN